MTNLETSHITLADGKHSNAFTVVAFKRDVQF